LSILIQVAALYQRLKETGRSPAEKFNKKLIEVIREKTPQEALESLRFSDDEPTPEPTQQKKNPS